MTMPVAADAGSELARTPASATMPEAPVNTTLQSSRLLNAWQPSERRRLGLLSMRSYEQAGMACPTDVWSYQRMFIEQQRDAGNPWAVKIGGR